jgi:hypothetical protein
VYKTDNGSPFQSCNFKAFAENLGVPTQKSDPGVIYEKAWQDAEKGQYKHFSG